MSQSISVALCSHNGARFIEEQLSSILDQTYAPLEIVLSDDASTDGTVEIAQAEFDRYVAAHPGSPIALRIIRNPTALGVVKNFEQAVELCVADLIALCDQDDRWASDRLARMIQELETRSEILLVHGNARLVDSEGTPLGSSLFDALEMTQSERREIATGDGFIALLGRNLVTGATTVFRRSLLEQALPFPPEWIHDEWLAIIAAATGSIDFLAAELIDYRQHGSNAIGAERLSLRQKLGKLREPRAERNERLTTRAQILVDRLVDLGDHVPERHLELARANLEHKRFRLSLPGRRLARIAPVLREARLGRYRLFGRGRIDVLRDLVQPV